MQSFLLEEMTSDEAGKALETVGVVIIPWGSTEQQGPAGCLGLDNLITWEIAKRVGERTGAIVLPLIPLGYAMHHMDFAGTITLEAETLAEVMREVFRSLIKHGVRKIVVINGHGGNTSMLEIASRDVRKENRQVIIAVLQYWESKIVQHTSGHPEIAELSLALAISPKSVRLEKLENCEVRYPLPPNEKIPPSSYSMSKIEFGGSPVRFTWFTSEFADRGSWGRQLGAQKERGEKTLKSLVDNYSEFIEYLKSIPPTCLMSAPSEGK